MNRKQPITPDTKITDFLNLIDLVNSRGNKIEVVNGKIYEVRRKLIGDMNDYK